MSAYQPVLDPACGYVDCSEGVTWFKDPARIAIMYSHVKLAVPWEEPARNRTEGGKRMSKTIRYVECAHCGEVVGTYYVTCHYCGYRLAVHSQPPREKCAD